jgi:hypothetical protein
MVKAIAIDMFTNAWTNWQASDLVYEENMTSGNQGIFLRYGTNNVNVSRFFTNRFSTNGYANMFSRDVPAVFGGPIYPAFSSNGYASLFPQEATNDFDATIHPDNSLPLAGGYGYFLGDGMTSNNYTLYDNLAYLTFATRNISFTLFGYSQGALINTVYDPEGNVGKVDRAEIIGAGTFSLNLTTNFLFRTNGYPDVVATVVPATNYTGLAHGTVIAPAPYYRLDYGPPKGP